MTQEAEYMGYVLDASGGEALVEMKNRFFVGDELETGFVNATPRIGR